jgi:molybdate transport system regulatory protein
MPSVGPLKVKIQLYTAGERAMGPGRADVLAAIDKEGSISAAGRSLGMSYRFTWSLVDSMNRCFRDKLVEAAPGGSRGGRAVLTDTGRKVLEAYRALEEQILVHSAGPALDRLEALLANGEG